MARGPSHAPIVPDGKVLSQQDSRVARLHPSFPGKSSFMAAVVGYVLDESFTHPAIAKITVSEVENLVCIRKAGAAGFAEA
jgi:hypothetical protein